MKPIIFLTLLAVAVSLQAQSDLNVVPAVQMWQPATGEFKLTHVAFNMPGAGTDGLREVARRFASDLAAVGFRNTDAPAGDAAAAPAQLVLTLDHGQHKLKPEGYYLEIGDYVSIRGADVAGVFYGTRTVLQLLAQHTNTWTLPKGVITDWPQYAHRMLMLDVGRKPYPLAVLRDYLRVMSWYKMNELHLHLSDEAFGGAYTGFRVECDTFPGLSSKDLYYTKADLRGLQDAARQLGITITPEIDMPGHARCFTDYWPDLALKGYPDYLDVTNPQTVERLKKLLDEMIPLFDAPDFHIGTDEYRVGGTPAEKLRLHEGFRQFINTMNAHIRARGKNTRIWSGFENMQGTTAIATNVTIDMWETHDAKSQIAQGHNIINSSDGRTYIVPGAHYYGVSNGGIYNSWEPWMVSGDLTKNPSKDDPHLLGGKLHVWSDQGPTGYTMTEIANLTLPSLQAFAEKLWGTKGSKDYSEFQTRAALTEPVPGVTVFNRLPARDTEGLVLDVARGHVLGLIRSNDVVALPYDNLPRADLEYPWTLSMEVCKTAETGRRGVILSSTLAEICSDYTQVIEQKTKDADGKVVKTKVTKQGLGVVRAAGSPGADPASSHIAADVSRVYAGPLMLNQWTTIAIVGERRHTTVYVNGVKAGESGEQMICPLAMLGSKTGNSFVGKVRNLRVWDHALDPKVIAVPPEADDHP